MEELNKAIEIIKQGGIVIYPTDTAFGIGCRVDSEESLNRLFEIRKRPETKAMPVLFDSISQVKDYVLPFDSDVESLMNKHWPGALTIVLPCKTEKVPSSVKDKFNTYQQIRNYGGNLLLDIGPDNQGRIDEKYAKFLIELKAQIEPFEAALAKSKH